jgi:hypothetical protein
LKTFYFYLFFRVSVSEVSVSGFYAMWFAKVAKNWIGEDT